MTDEAIKETILIEIDDSAEPKVKINGEPVDSLLLAIYRDGRGQFWTRGPRAEDISHLLSIVNAAHLKTIIGILGE